MTVIGIQKNGANATLHLTTDFESYFSNPELGRICTGKAVKSVYVGDFDISNIKVGSEIDILYGAPISTKSGAYAPNRKTEIIK